MNKLLLCITISIFACVSAVQAGDDAKAKAAAKGGCCAEQAKSDCSAKSSCCASAKVVKKADTSVKGATLLVRR